MINKTLSIISENKKPKIPNLGERVNFVKKGWGSEEWLINDTDYCVKVLNLKKGKKCSLHCHGIKKETFYVLKGVISLRLKTSRESKTYVLERGDFITILPGVYHQFLGLKDAKFLECSTQHFDSDSYRIEPGDSQK